MKFAISYIPEEEQEAAADLAALLRRHPGARVHKNDGHPPFKRLYLTTKKPEKYSDTKKNGCNTPGSVV